MVPANNKWFRNLVVAETIVETLRPYKKIWRKNSMTWGVRARVNWKPPAEEKRVATTGCWTESYEAFDRIHIGFYLASRVRQTVLQTRSSSGSAFTGIGQHHHNGLSFVFRTSSDARCDRDGGSARNSRQSSFFRASRLACDRFIVSDLFNRIDHRQIEHVGRQSRRRCPNFVRTGLDGFAGTVLVRTGLCAGSTAMDTIGLCCLM